MVIKTPAKWKFSRGFLAEKVDNMSKKCILYLYNKIPVNLPEMLLGPEEEDSLENTLSCVPKVQGESRISQANGRRKNIHPDVFMLRQSFRGCCFYFVFYLRRRNYAD